MPLLKFGQDIFDKAAGHSYVLLWKKKVVHLLTLFHLRMNPRVKL